MLRHVVSEGLARPVKSEERHTTRTNLQERLVEQNQQEFLVTSSSSDEGGDEEGEQGKRYQEAFSRVEFDAKCMGAKFLSAVKGRRRNLGKSKDPADQPATEKRSRGELGIQDQLRSVERWRPHGDV